MLTGWKKHNKESDFWVKLIKMGIKTFPNYPTSREECQNGGLGGQHMVRNLNYEKNRFENLERRVQDE